MTNKKYDPSKPYIPFPYDIADVSAVQAVAAGRGNEEQQKRVVAWIIAAAGTYDLSYRPTSDRDTAFAEGRRFLGLQIVKLNNLSLRSLQAAAMKEKKA